MCTRLQLQDLFALVAIFVAVVTILIVTKATNDIPVVTMVTENFSYPYPYSVNWGDTIFIDKTQPSKFGAEIFCYDGTVARPWHIFRTVQIFIGFEPKISESGEFHYFVAETPSAAYGLWLDFESGSTVISRLSTFVLTWPVRLFFGPTSGSDNSTLDRFFSAPSAITLNPFDSSCVAISAAKSYTASLHVSTVSVGLTVITMLGFAIFLAGPLLATKESFYYVSGSSLGIVMFALLAVFVIFRNLPMRRPAAIAATVVGTSALWIGMARRIWEFLLKHYYISSGFIALAAMAGFCFSYWYGPPSSSRVKNLVNWSLQSLGIFLITAGTWNIPIISAILVIGCLIYRNKQYFTIPMWVKLLYYKVVPFQKRLLTQEEYEQEGREETLKQVDALRQFVNSPACNQWDLARRLNNPVGFAHFASAPSTPNPQANGSFMAQIGLFDNDDDDDNVLLDDSSEVISEDDD